MSLSVESAVSDIIVFKSNSADKKPGKGVHERVVDSGKYERLASFKDFRRYLSNFDSSCTFTWKWPHGDKEYTFRSIEHAFQAAKIAQVDTLAAFRFTVESGDPIGAGDGSVAQKNRKLIKLSPEQIELWDSISGFIMASAASAKYKQNPQSIAAQVLKATCRAELWHLSTSRGSPSSLVRFEHLELIRDSLV